MKTEPTWDDLCDAIDEVMAETGIRSRTDAADIARQRDPALAKVKPPVPGMSSTTQPRMAPTGGSAEARLTTLAKQIMAERRCTFAQAYVEALKSNPALYVQFLKEHEARLAAPHRG